MIYFVADMHLGHKSIIELCNRPFDTIEEMDETLINNWNEKVKKNDVVYIIGDLIWKGIDPSIYLKRLNGKKILIIGNHDSNWMCKCDVNEYFELVTNMHIDNLNSHAVTMCHYPMLEWKNSRKEGTNKLGYLIYGHIHNRVSEEYHDLFTFSNALNAGVDINNYQPVSFDELIENNNIFKEKVLKNTDKNNIFQKKLEK